MRIDARSALKPFTKVAQWLHWIMAALIFGMAIFGWTLDVRQDADLTNALSIHATGGLLIVGLLILRLLWRISNPPPILPDTISAPQKAAANFIHVSLYFLMLIVPITGLIAATAHNAEVSILWNLQLKELFSFLGHEDYALKRTIHANAIYLLVFLVLGHISAALVHQYWQKDGMLDRMTR